MNRQEKEEWNRGRLSDRQQVVAGRLLDALVDVEDRWIVEAHREEAVETAVEKRRHWQHLPLIAAMLGLAAVLVCGIAGDRSAGRHDEQSMSVTSCVSLPTSSEPASQRQPLLLTWTWNPVVDTELEGVVFRVDWLHLRLEGHPDAEFVREQVSVPEDPAVWIRVLVREKGAVIGVAAWRVVFRNAAWQAKLMIAEEFFEPMPEKAARDRLDRWIREQTSSNPAA